MAPVAAAESKAGQAAGALDDAMGKSGLTPRVTPRTQRTQQQGRGGAVPRGPPPAPGTAGELAWRLRRRVWPTELDATDAYASLTDSEGDDEAVAEAEGEPGAGGGLLWLGARYSLACTAVLLGASLVVGLAVVGSAPAAMTSLRVSLPQCAELSDAFSADNGCGGVDIGSGAAAALRFAGVGSAQRWLAMRLHLYARDAAATAQGAFAVRLTLERGDGAGAFDVVAGSRDERGVQGTRFDATCGAPTAADGGGWCEAVHLGLVQGLVADEWQVRLTLDGGGSGGSPALVEGDGAAAASGGVSLVPANLGDVQLELLAGTARFGAYEALVRSGVCTAALALLLMLYRAADRADDLSGAPTRDAPAWLQRGPGWVVRRLGGGGAAGAATASLLLLLLLANPLAWLLEAWTWPAIQFVELPAGCLLVGTMLAAATLALGEAERRDAAAAAAAAAAAKVSSALASKPPPPPPLLGYLYERAGLSASGDGRGVAVWLVGAASLSAGVPALLLAAAAFGAQRSAAVAAQNAAPLAPPAADAPLAPLGYLGLVGAAVWLWRLGLLLWRAPMARRVQAAVLGVAPLVSLCLELGAADYPASCRRLTGVAGAFGDTDAQVEACEQWEMIRLLLHCGATATLLLLLLPTPRPEEVRGGAELYSA